MKNILTSLCLTVALTFLGLAVLSTPALAGSVGVSGKYTDLVDRIAGWQDKLAERIAKSVRCETGGPILMGGTKGTSRSLMKTACPLFIAILPHNAIDPVHTTKTGLKPVGGETPPLPCGKEILDNKTVP